MSDTPEHLSAVRRVPGWTRRWFILVRLNDYLLGDAPVLFGLWVRDRTAFWGYIMKVEESRMKREAAPKAGADKGQAPVSAPKRGAWRIE